MNTPVSDLRGALNWLDGILEPALAAAQSVYDMQETVPFHGLCISPGEAKRLAGLEPCTPTFCRNAEVLDTTEGLISGSPPLAWLARSFQLSAFDLAVAVIALAPELDLRYERIYGYLQDDMTRRRPSVDLALNLLCPSAEEKTRRRAHFTPRAPLLRDGLLHLVADSNQAQPPLLSHLLRVDSQIIGALTGEMDLDPRLTQFCRLTEPKASLDDPILDSDVRAGLRRIATGLMKKSLPLRLYFCGAQGVGKRHAAEGLAARLGFSLLVADLTQMPDSRSEFDSLARVMIREAWLSRSLLYLGGLDAFRLEDKHARWQTLTEMISGVQTPIVLAGRQPWAEVSAGGLDVISVNLGMPGFDLRRSRWLAELSSLGLTIETGQLDLLSARFSLTAEQIKEAVQEARNDSLWRCAVTSGADCSAASGDRPPTVRFEELSAAARRQCGHELRKLTRKVEARYSWSDIVLPEDQISQLREICDQARLRHVVYTQWGFERKLSRGRGLNVLFHGPPGTGKTMAAEVIAHELGIDLYGIDLSQVVSKYIGETEKNLDRIFGAAQNSNAILFFDEADALFGKRSEVKDSHDRYANIEIGYLLQKMEEYEGVAILATNLRQNLDEAFLRRLHSVVEFPFPDEEYRRRVWEVTFPAGAPVGEDVNFSLLAREVKLAGGNIKNIALAAAFYAAADGRTITMEYLARAARREYQKLARTWSEKGLVHSVQ